ncbi:MAG: hypothetical protein PWQ82_1258 [Thermosediminibacterales bacterium]|nr:hypothetical protein [Thermosediminibacterales bacterium]
MKIPFYEDGSRELKLKKKLMKGTDVRHLQQNLKRLGIYRDKVDGIFGTATKKAVISFQKTASIVPSGVFDYKTYLILKKHIPDRFTEWPAHQRDPGHSGNTRINIEPTFFVRWQKPIDSNFEAISALGETLLAFGDKKIVAVNLYTGKNLWHKNFSDSVISGTFMENGKAWFCRDREIVAFDIKNGKKATRLSFESPCLCPPLIYRNQIYIAAEDCRIVCIDELNGQPVWEKKLKAAAHAQPAAAGDLIIFGCSDKNLYALNWKTGDIKWKKRLLAPVSIPPAAAGDNFYAIGGESRVYSIKLPDGDFLWKGRIGPGGYMTPCIDDDSLYLPDAENNLYCIDGKEGSIKWSVNIKQSITGPPVSVPKYVLLPTERGLYVVSKASGSIKWKGIETESIKNVITAKFYIYVLTDDYIYSLGFKRHLH